MDGRRNWMWSNALDMLEQAERLHRQFFRPASSVQAPCWEPPVDILETEREVLILSALPGVAPDDVKAVIEGDALVISGVRTLPSELHNAIIHRLELPQGCFERKIPLPPGHYTLAQRTSVNGCLVVILRKAGG
jgi:HSP20 family molecular chaperone IbpA